jgi:hypothetical protein
MKNLFFVLALAASSPVCAQLTDRTTQIHVLVDSKNYVFHATTATSQDGAVKSLTSEYVLTLTPDSIACDLPYFGRAFAASGSDDVGIVFTSKDFSYDVQQTKKGGWEIAIKPKDVKKEASQMHLSIRANGLTTLRVTAPNKDPMTFDGEITSPGQ